MATKKKVQFNDKKTYKKYTKEQDDGSDQSGGIKFV